MEIDTKDTGSISEWNEGNFKNLRLHEAQEMINYGKVNPFTASEDRTSWRFQLWKAGIDVLFGEGAAKYGTDEKKKAIKIKSMVETFIALKPPFRTIIDVSIDGKNSKFIPVSTNQKEIKQLLEIYELIIKEYNDIHGLSTRNKEEEDITRSVVNN